MKIRNRQKGVKKQGGVESRLAGGCFCGAVRFLLSDGNLDAFYCHCRSCRKRSGAAYMAWGRLKNEKFQITLGKLKPYKSSKDVIRHFCDNCGTEILYMNTMSFPNVDFPLGILDNPEMVPPTYHVQTAEKVDWVNISDSLEQYQEWHTDGHPQKDEATD